MVNSALAGNQFYHDQEEERQQVTTFVYSRSGWAAENFTRWPGAARNLCRTVLRQDRWEDEEGRKRSRST